MIRPLLMIGGAWSFGLVMVIAGMIAASSVRYLEGEIVLEESPFCQFFVVRTPEGFTLATTDREDVALLSGYKAAGSLHYAGDAVLEIQANGRVMTRIERARVTQDVAIAEFERRCPDAAVPLIVLHPKSM